MPPWVVRQWHVWRCPRSVAGNLCHPQRFRQPIELRFYTQSSIRNGQKLQIRTANSAVIIPSSVENTRPEDLIAHIKPVYKSRVVQDRFAVFFVTPSFATWLLDDQVFLHKALRQAYAHILGQDQSQYARIHALCAVVDKLPISRSIGDVDNMDKEVLGRVVDPAVQETGREGIAYATLRFSDSIPTSAGVAQDKAAISFVASEGSGEAGHFSDSIRLPLANTIFQTGSPSTMTYSTWEKAKEAHDFTLREKREISHHGIRIRQDTKLKASALSVPLVPLSYPRQVEASMGNILRRVVGPDGASIAASQELEQIVPRYFKARGEPSQATTVWALVMDHDHMTEARGGTDFLLERAQSKEHLGDPEDKPEDKLWDNFWKQDPPVWSPMVPNALRSGARLHRVLSGGGGWGKKAGLLSLDPAPILETDSVDGSSDFDQFDGPGDLSSALQQVAHDGDYVQFFMSPSVPTEANVTEQSNQDRAVWGLELGTIPSTSDAMPAVPAQAETAKPNEITVHRYTFGALAEGGMVISRSFKPKPGDSFSCIGGSTVDVPFSRFSVANWVTAPESDEDADSFRSCLESKPLPYHRDLFNKLYGKAVSPFLGLPSFGNKLLRRQRNGEPYNVRGEEGSKNMPPQQERSRQRTSDIHQASTIIPQRILDSKRAFALSTETPSVPVYEHTTIHNDEQITKPLVPEEPLIRFYLVDTPQRDELAYCVDGLRRIDRKVARYVKEYRELMHQVRQQNGLAMDAALRQSRPRTKPLHPASLPAMQKMPSDSYDEVTDLVSQSQEVMPTTHEQTTSVITHRTNEILENIMVLRITLSGVLTKISFRAHMVLDANNAAVDVYMLNVQLRRQLAAMIMSRKRKGYRSHLLTSKLAHKLAQLRAFRENLFVGWPHLSKRYIHGRLQVLELQSHVSKKLMLLEGKRKSPLQLRRVVATPERLVWKTSGGEKKVQRQQPKPQAEKYNAVKELEEVVKGWIVP